MIAILALMPLLAVLSVNDGQLISSMLAFLFVGVSILQKSNTYRILALAMTANALIHWPLQSIPAYSLWWPAAYSTIDFLALAAIVKSGDAHIRYQTALISLMILMHWFLALDLWASTSIVFDWYYPAILLIMFAQICGGGVGVVKYYRDNSADYRRHKRGLYGHHHSKGSN